VQVFGIDDLAHGFVLEFTFDPGDDVEISKRAGFNLVIFQVFDLTD
jgi:hypothetical protein